MEARHVVYGHETDWYGCLGLEETLMDDIVSVAQVKAEWDELAM